MLCFAACSKKNKVVATIGSDTITINALADRIQETPPGYQNLLTTTAGKKQFLDLLVRERVVLEAAKQAGVTKRDEYKKTVADFRKEQARRMREYEENIMMEMFVKDLNAKQIGASDTEVEKYYQEHKNEYMHPTEVVARHILVSTKPEAEKVLERLNNGEDFAKIAKEVSIDPISAARGGEIGPFRKGSLVPEFETAVFALKVGQISGIVQTQFGFHIIKKVSEKAVPPMSEQEARQDVRKMLEKTKFDAWLNNAKKKMGVKINYDLLPQVIVPPPSMMMPSMQDQGSEQSSQQESDAAQAPATNKHASK